MQKIGVDIGGTTIKAGLVVDGGIKERITVDSPKTKKPFLEKLEFVIRFLDNPKVTSIGIGVPGPADYEKGIIGKTPNIPLKNFKLLAHLKKKFKKKEIKLENDASCYVLGEALNLKENTVIGLTLGTGVGGGIVINKKIFHGKGNAGELGRTIIEIDGITGKDRIEGSLENYVSGEAIKGILGKEPEKLTKKEWETYGMYLGVGLATLNNLIDPDIIVLGGSISNSIKLFQKSMKDTLKKRSINALPMIIVGKSNSAIIGAASIF